jgi:hypothetical protein
MVIIVILIIIIITIMMIIIVIIIIISIIVIIITIVIITIDTTGLPILQLLLGRFIPSTDILGTHETYSMRLLPQLSLLPATGL